MTNDSETVREVYERTVGYNQMCSFGYHEKGTVKRIADNFIAAHEREMAAKDAEIALLKESSCEYALPNHGCTAEDKHFQKTVELERKVALLKRALKCVMEFDENQHDKILNSLRAVREAKRIILEAWDDKNYFWNNRVAKKCREVKEC